ncbi:MAG: hypothetical protein JJU34_20260 [Lunatimonas sp.]|uniref:hypothetical protein n=1 Tax=Lunatimonas sp. TaxID=2060141 RepID=UPI00263AEBBB|nr:hypothetical protein [Lunatimonas sp.]MCC5939625.1 hypothetical protein [Lunatimonas sp.]
MSLIKSFFALSLITVFFFSPVDAMAQLSKQERKTWKKTKRKMSPEELKKLVDERTFFSARADSLEAETTRMLGTLRDQQASMDRLRTTQEQQNQQIAQLKQQLSEVNKTEPKSPWDKGVAFRVQFGAFKGHDISDMVQDSPDLELVKEDGFTKYVLGQFRNYDKADELKRYLRKIGVQHTWIVPYRDGKRVPLAEVLDEAMKEK